MRVLHGEVVEDPYAWLRDRDDPEVLAHLDAENAYAAARTAHLEPLRRELYEEFRARTVEDDLDVPARRGPWWYASRTEAGRPYRIWVRMRGAPDGPLEVLLDENELAAGHEYFRLGSYDVAPDHALVAYGVDFDGSERYELRIRVAGTPEELPDRIPVTAGGTAWAGPWLFYTVPDEAMRPHQVWRHRVGTDPAEDVLVYEEEDERFYLRVTRTRSGAFVLIEATSATTSEVFVVPTTDPEARPRSVLGRTPDVEYGIDHRGDRFWVVTDDDAVEGRLLTVPVGGGAAEEILPHDPERKLAAVDAFAGHVVVWGRVDGRAAAWILRDDGEPRRVDFPTEVYQLDPDRNLEYDTRALRLRIESPVLPPSIYDYDVVEGTWTLLKRTAVPGVDLDEYRAVALRIEASDGRRIPVTLVHRRDTPLDGSAPALVYAYGAYEASVAPRFSVTRLGLLDRGVVFAIAHVRGGGELGKRWHLEGRMATKRNTFTDLLAVVERLGAELVDARRIAVRGASAGGLTVGAALAMDPSRFRVVVAEVPFVDVVNTMLDETLPLTVVEWEEWGDPHDPDQYRWMRAYAPYENVAPVDYPAMLVTAGLNDPRVGYWEPAKWVAKIRATTTGSAPILLKTEMGAGHFSRSGRYGRWEDEAFVLAFVLDQLGVADPPESSKSSRTWSTSGSAGASSATT